MNWIFDDGGRSAAGFRGQAGDCACRAIAIATGKPYREVYDLINTVATDLKMHPAAKGSPARLGTLRDVEHEVMRRLGWVWTPTMRIGSGCRVHLRVTELPPGPLVVAVSRHLTAVVEGVIHDTHDPSRGGTRCVYGYWSCNGRNGVPQPIDLGGNGEPL